jgi:putative ABC transport system ATP-binding protein
MNTPVDSPNAAPLTGVATASNEHTPLIQLRNLTRSFINGEIEVKAVREISLSIEQGDFVAIMGASGSGKSTLMNMLGFLDQPSSGEYWLDGANVASLNAQQRAVLRSSKLGFVFQSFYLLSRTSALENVELPLLYATPVVLPRERHERAISVLEKVDLGKRLKHFPNQLSGGQQQRVAIARALVNNPEILLADEPTGNLDSRTSIEIMGLFQELNNNGLTIVMVTHELDIAAFCKRVVIMRDGKIISDTLNEKPHDAAQELASLDAAEQKAKLA